MCSISTGITARFKPDSALDFIGIPHTTTIATYPRLLRRIQAVLIDGIIVPVVAIGSIFSVSQMGIRGEFAASTAVLSIFIFEPFLVSTTGGTIGHHLLGIRVVDGKTMSKLGIIRATLRFIVKILLGLISLVVVLTSRRHQAVHDYLSGSIVIIKYPQALPAHEVLQEREIEEIGYVYPSKLRRTVIILLYSMIALFVYFILLMLLLTEGCLNDNVCNGYEQVLYAGAYILWLVGTVTVLVLGWTGRLWGCRRKVDDIANKE